MKLLYPAIFIPFSDGTGGYTVEIPDLPGCVSEGKDLIDAIEMGTDAASGWILDELEDGHNIPSPSDSATLVVPDGALVNLLVLDITAYSEKYGQKTIRKNITIPAWLNTYGERNNINFSKVLQDALVQKAQNI
ncbi:MAG: type II toxin-antitoxin system HicB family antitoxin [Bacteroidales bacterium]|nr:type II toxin-antitoxin system HicB family antitoxin [Clostridium sp.]MCM1203375.1 type II toxin-antitoxin system HicB family antitoxin [Bacteroidales bacterium]